MVDIFGDNRTNDEKILDFLREDIDNGYCDDCLSIKLKIKPRQQVNQICHILKEKRKVERIESACPICKKQKILNFIKDE